MLRIWRTWGRWLLLLAVLAGVAAGPAQGQDGSPILIVESYSTSPAPVNSGQGFTLTVTVKNIGTKHAEQIVASVSGGQFVQVGPSAQVGQIDPGFTATFSLQVQAGSLSTGAYDLGLSFAYRIGTSGEFAQPRSVGIQVQGSSTAITGDPQVVVESAAPLTRPASVGDTFDVLVVLRNAGPRMAYAVSVTLGQNDYLSPAVGSGSTQVGDLNAGATVTLTLSLVLEQASATGRVAQAFDLAYRDGDDAEHTSEESASLDLGATGRDRPLLIVSAHSSTPERPAPGDTITLSLTVTNVGSGAARRVLARLGSEAGLDPFLPLGTSNVGYADEILPGGSHTFTHTLLMDGEAEAGAYALAVELSYDDSVSENHTESETIGLLTLARPQVQIDLTKSLPNPAAVGEAFDIAVEIINIGRQRLEVSTVEISSTTLSLTKNALYVGPLDPSISGGLTAEAVAREAGPASFQVIIHYRDELNQMQTLSFDYQVDVEAASAFAPPATDTPAQSGGFWQAVMRLLGLGG
jgi:hypothetical protein